MYDFDPWKLVYLYLYMSCELPRVFFPVNVFATMIRTGEDDEQPDDTDMAVTWL